MEKVKTKDKTTNDSKYYRCFKAYPVKGYKSKNRWFGAELSEKEAYEVEKTMTIKYKDETIPIYIEREYVTIHISKTITEKA